MTVLQFHIKKERVQHSLTITDSHPKQNLNKARKKRGSEKKEDWRLEGKEGRREGGFGKLCLPLEKSWLRLCLLIAYQD